MILYLLQVSICWIILYAFYHYFLGKETFFGANRFYLIFSLLAGLSIPLMPSVPAFFQSGTAMGESYLDYIAYGPQIVVESISNPHTTTSGFSVLALLYAVGICFFASRMGYGLYQIYKIGKEGTKSMRDGYPVVESEEPFLPFSFFNTIYLSQGINLKEDLNEILNHEIAHIKGMHSVDILLLELLQIIFWFNPILILYKRAIRQSHEFTADQSVLRVTTRKNYGQLLLRQVQGNFRIAMANHFFHSQIKTRIKMMYKERSKQTAILKYLLFIPMMMLLTAVFASKDYSSSNLYSDIPLYSENVSAQDSIPKSEIFKVVEEMPRFPGCENVADMAERKDCAQQKMLEHIYKNLKYPLEAKKAGIEGMVVLQFVVTKEGKIADAKIKRDIGKGCGEASLATLESMNDLPDRWIPGKQRGKNVNVAYTLPVKFKLANDKKGKTDKKG